MTGESKTAAILNLGCSKNQIDGERILALLASKGYNITEDCALADVIVVNTCAFIKEAQEEAIDNILEAATLRKSGSCETLIVSGCFSERYRSKVKKEFPEVDIWAGVDDWMSVIPAALSKNHLVDGGSDGGNGSVGSNGSSYDDGDDDAAPISAPPALSLSPKKRASYGRDDDDDDGFKRILGEPLSTQYIKIAEGCSHKCSYCVIPSIRGKFKSRSEGSILKEAQWLYEQGARELILVAQDTSYYGRDTNTSLTRLLESLLKHTKFPWIRMMYLHPQFIDDDLLGLAASEERVCPYFDIPLQHISDPILRAMGRRPSSKDIYALIGWIRNIVDGATLRTSFIAGFPGETEREFEELKRFVQDVRFDKMGVFPFSPEDGTAAARMPKRPRAAAVRKRCEELMEIQREISREILEDKVGGRTRIIIDRISDDPDFNYEGRTAGDAPEVDGRVFVPSGSFEIGQILTGRIIGASDYDVYVEID
jgi:ribosomal protein S12 methylthiotransferase